MNNVILIATNGFDGTWPAVEYGAWVAETLGADILLLGIAESETDRADERAQSLDTLMDRAAALFRSLNLRYSADRRHGRCEEVVPRAALQVGGLTVLGPLGRPLLKRLLVGRSIRNLLEAVQTPVLYVPRARLPLRKMLICLGGLGYEITAEHIALRLGAAVGAEATLLHVAPPVDLEYPTARLEREHWRDLETTDSLLGRNLRAGLEAARAVGMKASLKARQGNVVEEIQGEVQTGAYDLICMGSAHGIGGLRHLYEPNVTEEVAEQAQCPLLTARFAPETRRAAPQE
jgi:nucleotide-binding universal stress UspA family protein